MELMNLSAICRRAEEAENYAGTLWERGARDDALAVLANAREELSARRPAPKPIRLPQRHMTLNDMVAFDGYAADLLKTGRRQIDLLFREFQYRYLFLGQGRAALSLLHNAIDETERYGKAASLLLLSEKPFDELLALGFVLEPVYEDALKRLYLHETLFPDGLSLVQSSELREQADWMENRFFMTECLSTRWRSRPEVVRDTAFIQSASMCMAVTDCVLQTLENRRPEKKEGDIWFYRLLWACDHMEILLLQCKGCEQPAWLETVIAPWVNHALFIVDLDTMAGFSRVAPAKKLHDCLRKIPAASDCPSAVRLAAFLEERKAGSLFFRLFGR